MMWRLLLRLRAALTALLEARPAVPPEEDPNRPAWNREAWKAAGRRGYRKGSR